MKLSMRVRYGSRAMLELALNYEAGPTSVSDIACHQHISYKYLEHLVGSLKTADLVKSIRGTHGGYMLARSPGKIKVSKIFQALEGSTAPVECVDSPETCSMRDVCAPSDIWTQMKEALTEILENTTLQNLLEQNKQKKASIAAMYYI